RRRLFALVQALVEAQYLGFTEDSAFYRVAPPAPTALDRPRPPGASGSVGRDTAQVQLFVVRLRHARASDVAATLNQLFGAGGEFSGRAGLSTGTLSDELRRNQVAPQGAAAPPSPTPSGGAPARPSALSGPVVIVPD